MLVKYSEGLYTKHIRISNGPQLFGLVTGVRISNGWPFWFGFWKIRTIQKLNIQNGRSSMFMLFFLRPLEKSCYRYVIMHALFRFPYPSFFITARTLSSDCFTSPLNKKYSACFVTSRKPGFGFGGQSKKSINIPLKCYIVFLFYRRNT